MMKTTSKENPKIKERLLPNGRIALYLETYYGSERKVRTDENGKPILYSSGKMAGKPQMEIHHNRKKEQLKLYLYQKPRTPEERQHNKDSLEIAKRVRFEREQALINDEKGYRLDSKKSDNLISFFENYLNDYTKKDLRNVRLAINRFKSFLREKYPVCTIRKSPAEIKSIDKIWKERHRGIHGKHEINPNEYYRFYLKPERLNKEMVSQFVEYLSANSIGSGAKTAYGRFKKIVRYASESGILRKNPCEGISCRYDDNVLVKDVLSEDEVRMLINTHYDRENPEIRRAFIFSLYTGIRFCDVKDLRFSDIDYTNQMLSFEQEKVKGHSRFSRVTLPIRDDLLAIVGTPEEYGRVKEDRIFILPSHTMCLKALRKWTAKAGVEKHITWHCARHTFATLVLERGANIAVVATLLGHSGLSHTEKYTRARDEKMKAAMNSLPEL